LLFGDVMKKTALAVILVLALLFSSHNMKAQSDNASAQITTPTPIPPVTPSSSPTPPLTPTPPIPTPTPTPNPPKPAVPEFTVKLISSLPESNKTAIELTIRNQPFDKSNIYNYSFVYNVRIRTSEENWTDLYDAEDGYPTQSDSDYTVLPYVLGESAYYPPADYPLSPSMRVGILPTSGQVDFQVQAMIGHRDRGAYSNGIMPYVFRGETSGWSNTQTLTISDSPTPTAEPFPTTLLFVASVGIALTVIGLLVHFKKRK
jgi:hypothetical protein